MKTPGPNPTIASQTQGGFTLLEVTIALVIMMIVTLAAAALFAYSINYNSGAYDRTLAHAVAQKQMEYLSRSSFDNLVSTSQPQTLTSAGRIYSVATTVCSSVSCGGTDKLKKITIDVTPQGAGANWVRSAVRIETLRAARGTGPYF